MRKYFDNPDEGFCYGLKHYKDEMVEIGETEMLLWEGVREFGQDHFYCSEYQEVGLKEDSDCGKLCEGYSPLNGKNGRCRHSKSTYFPGDKYLLTRVGKRFKLQLQDK